MTVWAKVKYTLLKELELSLSEKNAAGKKVTTRYKEQCPMLQSLRKKGKTIRQVIGTWYQLPRFPCIFKFFVAKFKLLLHVSVTPSRC